MEQDSYEQLRDKTASLRAVLEKLSEDEISRSVLVSSIPQGTKEEAIIIHFQKRKHGGGDVSAVTLVEQDMALLTFDDAETVRTVLSIEHRIGEALLNVAQCPAARRKVDMGEVFNQVSAWLDPHLLSVKAEDASKLVTEITKKIGVGFEGTDNNFVITGSLAQINKCQQLLLQHLSEQEMITSAINSLSLEAGSHHTGGEEGVATAVNKDPDTRSITANKSDQENIRKREMQRTPAAETLPGNNVQTVNAPDIAGLAAADIQTINTRPLALRFVMHVYRTQLDSIQDRYCVELYISSDNTSVTLQPLEGCNSEQYNEACNVFFNLMSTASQGTTTWELDLKDMDQESVARMVIHVLTKCPVLIEKKEETGSLVVYGDFASVEQVKQVFQGGRSRDYGQMSQTGGGDPLEAHGGDPLEVHGPVQEATAADSIEIYKFRTKNGVTISLFYGDITEERVDAIVNPANGQLVHGAGLAKLILDKGGHEIDRESRNIMIHRGWLPVNVGQAVYTCSGRLPCKVVIHAVGPEWGKEPDKTSRGLLKKSCFESLQLASKLGLRSIALPAISSGVFRAPVKECAKAMLTALEDFLQKTKKEVSKKEDVDKSSQKTKTPKEAGKKMEGKKKGVPTNTDKVNEDQAKGGICDIRFVLIDADAMDVFEKEFAKRFGARQTVSDDDGMYV